MVYLDGDIQVFDNIDHLFHLPDGYFYAVMDCFCENSWRHTPQYKIGYCQQCPEKVNWPDDELGPKPSLYFNAGMFVFEPSLSTCDDLLKKLQITTPTSFAEQDFLNLYFNDIYKPISLTYNLVLAMLWRLPENVQLDQVKVVHYCAALFDSSFRLLLLIPNFSFFTPEAENMDREDIKMLVKKWWDIYNNESLDYMDNNNNNNASGEKSRRLQPSLVTLADAGPINFITNPSAV